MTVTVDTFTEDIRTGTDSPHTFSHAGAASGVRGVLLALIHGTSSTDYITAASYGGVAMTRKQRNTDTATEPGAAEWWFVGSGIPQGTQTVSYTCGSTTDDILACCITLLGTGDTVVIDVDGLNEDQTNPSRTMNYGGRSAMSFAAFYSGLTATTSITAGTNCTKVGTAELAGNFTSAVIRQTTAGTSDFTIAATAAADDTAFACVSVADGDKTVAATVTALTFTPNNPTVAVSRNANATVTALTFASFNPSAGTTFGPGVAPIATLIQRADRTRRAPSMVILTPRTIPADAAAADLNVNATIAALTFTQRNATVSESRDLTATSTAFIFTARAATVGKARNANASTTALTFTPRATTVDKGRAALATSTAFTFTPRAVSLNEARGVLVTSVSFTFASFNATVTKGVDRNVAASVAPFTFATFKPTVTQGNDRFVVATSAAFTFTARAATIAKPLSLTAGVASFTFTVYATSVAKLHNVDASVATFSFATHPATIPLSSIDLVIAAREAPDIASIALESEGVAPPSAQGGRNGFPRYPPLYRAPNEIVIRATEAPDVCRILLETDWSADDEEFLALAMGAAA